MRESDLTLKIKKALGQQWPGAYFIKIPGTRYLAGVPDLIGCVDGRFVAIEVKRPDTSYGVTERQAANIDLITKAGGIAFVTTSVEHSIATIEQLLWPEIWLD